MKKSFLDDYRSREIDVGRKIASQLLTTEHVIRDPSAVFPEYDTTGGLALHRPGVNLGALLFLHPKAVAYVPPMKPADFPGRFGVSYETFLELAYPPDGEAPFILPVLNHPRHYAAIEIRSGLSEILLRTPPTWERWHEALRVSGGIQWFEKADEIMPYSRIWSIPDYRAYWAARFPNRSKAFISREIKQQLRNNFTDLCLIGMEDEARDIAETAKTDPPMGMSRLFFSSELFAYSEVMGAGGTPQLVAVNPLHMREYLRRSLEAGLPDSDAFAMDTEVVEVLLEGLQFHRIPKVYRADFLRSFHKSEQAVRVRAAYASLLAAAASRTPSLEDVHNSISEIASELRNFCESSKVDSKMVADTLKSRQTVYTILCSLGGVLLGAGGFFGMPGLLAFAAGTSATAMALLPLPTRQRIERALLLRYFPDLDYGVSSSMLGLREFRNNYLRALSEGDHPPSEVIDRPLSTSLKPRTLWWSDDEGE